MKDIWKKLEKPVISLLLAFVVGWIILVAADYDAPAGFGALFEASFGSIKVFTSTLNKATPLLFCGLAYAIANRGHLMNIGCDGQLRAGAILASIVAIYMGDMPRILLLPVTLLAGALGGALWAFIPVYLKAKNNISEVITTIMFNYLALHLLNYLVCGPIKNQNSSQNISWNISENAMLNVVIPGTKLHAGFFLGLIFAVLLYLLLFKTTFGYEIRAVGLNRTAAKTCGINDTKVMTSTMMMSGALAGIGGAVEVMGTTYYLIGTITDNYGFTAIAVSMLAGNNPIAIIFSAIVFGILRNGASAMQRMADISSSFVEVFEGILIIFIAIASVKGVQAIKKKKTIKTKEAA